MCVYKYIYIYIYIYIYAYTCIHISKKTCKWGTALCVSLLPLSYRYRDGARTTTMVAKHDLQSTSCSPLRTSYLLPAGYPPLACLALTSGQAFHQTSRTRLSSEHNNILGKYVTPNLPTNIVPTNIA